MNNNVGPGQFILSLPEKRAHIIWLNHIKPVHSHRCFAQDAYARASVTVTLRGYTGHKAAASPPGPAFDMLKPGYESRRMGITSHVSGNFPREISTYTPCKRDCAPAISTYTSCKRDCAPAISTYTPCKRDCAPAISTCTPCNGKIRFRIMTLQKRKGSR